MASNEVCSEEGGDLSSDAILKDVVGCRAILK
jgi:hypothetical protein